MACPYKTLHNSNILLIYKNSIIDIDDSSIDYISDGEIIIIIEDRFYPDDSYYNKLIQNNKNNKMKHFRIKDSSTAKIIENLIFPENITIKEMYKALYLKFGYNGNNCSFLNYVTSIELINLLKKYLIPIIIK